MDWQTKEYIDEKFNDIEDRLDSIIDHFKIEEDNEEVEEESNSEEVTETLVD